MENFPFRLFCDSFQKALSRVLEAPDPESNEDAANCHRLRHFFLLKLFFQRVILFSLTVTDSKNIFPKTQSTGNILKIGTPEIYLTELY